MSRFRCGCDYCVRGRTVKREKLADLEQIRDALLVPEGEDEEDG